MRTVVLILVGFFIILGSTLVMGQVEGDTLGLTGTMADTVVANQFLNEAIELNKQGGYEEAFVKADSAEQLFVSIIGTESKEVADALHQKGTSLFLSRRYEDAIASYSKSLLIRTKVTGILNPDAAASYNNIGICYRKIGNYKRAIESHNEALIIRTNTPKIEEKDLSATYNNLGLTYVDISEYDTAVGLLKKALEINLKVFGSESNEVSNIFNNLGLAYSGIEQYDNALDCFSKGLKIRIKILGPEHQSVAMSYNNIGTIFGDKGDYKSALYYQQKSLDIRLKVLGPTHLDVAMSFGNIGNIYYSIRELEKSLEYQNKSLMILLQNLNPEHPEISKVLNNLGNTYEEMGDYEKSLFCLEKALKIKQNIFGPESPDVAITLDNLGVLYRVKGESEKALQCFENALNIQTKAFGPDHPDNAMSIHNMASIYDDRREYSKAIDLHLKALNINTRTRGKDNSDIASSYRDIGLALKKQGKYLEAIKFYEMTLSICRPDPINNEKIYPFEQFLKSIIELSEIYKIQFIEIKSPNLLNKSLNYCVDGLNAIVNGRYLFASETSKSFHLSKNYPIYEQAISVSLLKAEVDHNDTLRQNTFSYAEKSKASLLQAQIKAADAINFSGIPDSLLQKEYKLRVDITWHEKQRQSLLDQGLSETDTNTLRISSIIFDLKRNYETLKQRFETEYPEYYRLKYDLSTVSLQYVQDTLLESPNQALLEYFVGDSSIFLFVVRPDTMIVEEVKRDFPLEDWIQGLRHGLYGYYTAEKLIQTDSLKADARSKYLEFAPKLYEKLVAPVAQYLPEKVILVPDGPLGYVPFDALLTGAPEDLNNFKSYPYLLQKHQFSYTYSATLLREMRDKKHRQEPEKDFIAFAPFYNGDTTLLASMYAYDELMRKDLQPLAYSGPEVAAASKLMRGETIAGAAATEERFISMASDYRIIHLATHGRADNRVGDYAFLAFTEIKDSIENELLYVKDLYNLSLNADLVVLSACETGIGKLQRGEGIISLARAFAYAGAKSIVTSLWSVNDKSTSELMRFFYRELKRGKDKDEALRLARLRFLKESSVRNSHPFFWAAFVPIGDMRPVK